MKKTILISILLTVYFSVYSQSDSTRQMMQFSAGFAAFVSSNSNGNAFGPFISAHYKKHALSLMPFIGSKIAFSKSITDKIINTEYAINGAMLSYSYCLSWPKKNFNIILEDNFAYYHYSYQGIEDYYSPLVEDEAFTSKRNIFENNLGAGLLFRYKSFYCFSTLSFGGAHVATVFNYPTETTTYNYFNYSGLWKLSFGYTFCK